MTAQECYSGTCSLAMNIAYVLEPLRTSLASATDDVSIAAPWLWPVLFGILGAIAVSVAGLVVDRLPLIAGWRGKPEVGLSLSSPGSHCDACGEPLDPVALIPVLGWFVKKGQCGSCGASVPWIYPAVEGATALVSALIVWRMGMGSSALLMCVAVWVLVFVSWIDWKEQEIPDAATVPLLFLGLLASPLEPDTWSRVAGSALTALCIWGAFRITTSMKGEDAMSYGDVALGAALGGWLGLCGVAPLLGLSCAAYIAYAAPMRSRGIVWMPMGPALAAGFLATAALGLHRLLA